MSPVRVIDVEDLGWDSALVEIEGESVLLLDVLLTDEQRREVLLDVMAGTY